MRRLVPLLLGLAAVLGPGFAMSAEPETIAIIGTGDLGDSFGPRLAKLGYTIVYGSRSPDSRAVRDLVARTGHGASATGQKDAAQQGDIVFLPITWPAMESVVPALGDLDGKIVVDPSLPWAQAEDGYPVSALESSSAEMIQQWLPGARVVKAFGTMGSGVIDDPQVVGGTVTIPIASDDPDAKRRIAMLAAELGLDPVDFGPLRMARSIEALGLIYMIPLLQHREAEWEFQFRRNKDWVCRFLPEWSEPVYDADNLAGFPTVVAAPETCR